MPDGNLPSGIIMCYVSMAARDDLRDREGVLGQKE